MGEQFKELEKLRKEVAKMETKRDQDDHQITRWCERSEFLIYEKFLLLD